MRLVQVLKWRTGAHCSYTLYSACFCPFGLCETSRVCACACVSEDWTAPYTASVFLLGQEVRFRVFALALPAGWKLGIHRCHASTAQNPDADPKHPVIDNYGYGHILSVCVCIHLYLYAGIICICISLYINIPNYLGLLKCTVHTWQYCMCVQYPHAAALCAAGSYRCMVHRKQDGGRSRFSQRTDGTIDFALEAFQFNQEPAVKVSHAPPSPYSSDITSFTGRKWNRKYFIQSGTGHVISRH